MKRKLLSHLQVYFNCKFDRTFSYLNYTADLNGGRYRLESLTSTRVIRQIELAKEAVIHDLNELGIDTSKLEFRCQIKPVSEEDLMSDENQDDSEVDSDCEEPYELRAEDFFVNEEDEYDEELQDDVNFLSGIPFRRFDITSNNILTI